MNGDDSVAATTMPSGSQWLGWLTGCRAREAERNRYGGLACFEGTAAAMHCNPLRTVAATNETWEITWKNIIIAVGGGFNCHGISVRKQNIL